MTCSAFSKKNTYKIVIKIVSLNRSVLFFDLMYHKFLYWAFRFSCVNFQRVSSAPHRSLLKSSFVNKRAQRQYVSFRNLTIYTFSFLLAQPMSSLAFLTFQELLVYQAKMALRVSWPLAVLRVTVRSKTFVF